MKVAPERLAELLESIARVRTLVIGDAMLDEYIWGNAERISPEAPVMVIRSERTSQVPGGAANVINCIRALGGQAGLGAVVGDDEAGRLLRARLSEAGVAPLLLVVDPDRPTTVKTRVVAHSQQVLRIDREVRGPLSAALASELDTAASEALAACDGLLLSDYDKGVLTPDSVPPLLAAARARGVRVAVNAKPHFAGCYRGVDLVTVNRVEAEAVTGISPDTLDLAERAAHRLGESLGCAHVLVTLGPDGALLREADGRATHLAAVPVQVYDPAGAGDTTIAATHLALCAGAAAPEAVALAMLAAAVAVRKVGVQTVTPEEILSLASG